MILVLDGAFYLPRDGSDSELRAKEEMREESVEEEGLCM